MMYYNAAFLQKNKVLAPSGSVQINNSQLLHDNAPNFTPHAYTIAIVRKTKDQPRKLTEDYDAISVLQAVILV